MKRCSSTNETQNKTKQKKLISISLQYILILLLVLIGYKVMNSSNEPTKVEEEEEEKEIDPPRNFTQKQLIYFDGKKDEKTKEEKPVYLSVNGIVFDVSDGRSFYGPDGPYENFAGHECGVALAKMSFETEHLDDLKGCKDLNFGEKEELDGWVEKFTYYRHYPVKGRLIAEDDLNSLADRILTSDDLSKYTGDDGEEIPEGYAAPPIYIGAGDKVFDASFGGAEFYGKLNEN
jgi:membrane-associated progesterone receptor component